MVLSRLNKNSAFHKGKRLYKWYSHHHHHHHHHVQTLTTRDCKGPQTNMPNNVGSIKTWSVLQSNFYVVRSALQYSVCRIQYVIIIIIIIIIFTFIIIIIITLRLRGQWSFYSVDWGRGICPLFSSPPRGIWQLKCISPPVPGGR